MRSDLEKREVRWTYEAGEAVDATPAISGGRVFIGAYDKVFRALEFASGEEIWRIKGRYEFPTGATVVDAGEGEGQRVVVNGYDGITRCLRCAGRGGGLAVRDGRLSVRHAGGDRWRVGDLRRL